MKKRSYKDIAIFLVFLVISITFSFSTSIKSVQAQTVGCCEETTNGEFCVDTLRENCESSAQFQEFVSCDEASFCSEDHNICCFYPETGACDNRQYDQECISNGGQPKGSVLCSEVAECSIGCCVIGSQCFTGTQRECELETQNYPLLNLDFRAGLDDGYACQDICGQQVEGCCIIDESTYVYGAQVECPLLENFYANTFCEDLDNSPCVAEVSKGCYDGDVHWEDSCGNKGELVEDCDPLTGTLCKEDEELNTAECIDLSCSETYTDQWNVHDLRIGGVRDNGESWCIYESATGNYLDRPGSKHYRHFCMNGEEIAETCRDYREEICLQGSADGSIDWEDPTQTQDFSDPFTSLIMPDLTPFTLPFGPTGAGCIENEIYESDITQQSSTVPLGFAFWESQGLGIPSIPSSGQGARELLEGLMHPSTQSERDGESICAQANEQVTVKWQVPSGPLGCSEKCIKNCYAEEQTLPKMGKWITKKGEDCKALGDCGIDFGVEATMPSGFPFSFIAFWYGSAPGPKPTLIDIVTIMSWGMARGVQSGMGGLFNTVSDIVGPGGLLTGGGGHGAGMSQTSTTWTGAGIGALGFIAGPLGIITTIIGAILGSLMGCETKEKTVYVVCRPWEAPGGGANCNLCRQPDKWEQIRNPDGSNFNTCTEYRCKALGKACEFIPETVEGPDCIDTNPGDVSPPTISPNYERFEEQNILNNDINDNGRAGFAITKILSPFTPIILAFRTDELAECSYTTLAEDLSKPFEELPNPISGLAREHEIPITFPDSSPTEPLTSRFYVKCQDAHNNANTQFYVIEFTVNNEPDLTPPVIEDILGPKLLTYDQTEAMYDILVSDYSLINECHYSIEGDLPFDNMGDSVQCLDHRPDGLYYHCFVELTDLVQGENKFYFKCQDEHGHTMQDDYELIIQGSTELIVQVVDPTPVQGAVIYDNDVVLAVRTSGGVEDGQATCEYTYQMSTNPFFNTGDLVHTQELIDLIQGNYQFGVQCSDAAGNSAATSMEFSIGADTEAPRLLHLYKQGGVLYIYLNEATICKYADFDFVYDTEGSLMTGQDSLSHSAPLTLDYYFIKCRDVFDNELEGIEIVP